MTMTRFSALSDKDLLAEAKRLATVERHAVADLIRSLMELDSRRLYLGESCASLYTFCTQVLGLCESAAYNRIEVARAARRVPAILAALEDGSLTLTNARLLSPHLTEANHPEILTAARYKSKRQVGELVATLTPRPDAPPELHVLPEGAEQRDHIGALSTERYRIQFTIGRETRDKLQEVQDLLRHSIRNGDLEEIFDRALTLLLKNAQRQRFADTCSGRLERPPAPSTRYLRAGLRRAVWRRDQGRCAFVGANGRCTETTLLQFHHKIPFAVGGPSTVDNIELRCAAHNHYEAELFFGADYPDLVREYQPAWPGDLVPERADDWHNRCANRCG
jgi:hypothetical protein